MLRIEISITTTWNVPESERVEGECFVAEPEISEAMSHLDNALSGIHDYEKPKVSVCVVEDTD